jgi:DNA-binding NarL/FixJ family response regulator
MLDLRLPDMDGIAAIDQLSELEPAPKILLFTARADDGVMLRLFRDPVAGLLWKSQASTQELPRALTTIAGGGKYYSADAQQAWQRFRAAPDSYFKILTATEIKLLPLCAQGFSDDEIAANLGCKTATAHTHRKNIMAKTGLHSQVELQTWALQRGFFDPPLAGPPCLVAWTE